MSDISWLYKRFLHSNERVFRFADGHPFNTYADLYNEVIHWRKVLKQANIGNSVVSLEGDFSTETTALLLALVELDCIVVPLSSAADKEAFKLIAEVQTCITPEDIVLTPRVVHNPLINYLLDMRKPGLILFSSGSTGEPKASLHDFTSLLEKFKTPRTTFTTLTFLLMDHLGGINTLLYTLSNTGTIVTVDERTPDKVLRAVQDCGVQLLPTSPTFLNLILLSEAYKRYDLSSLERITYGTEVMQESILKRLNDLLPDVEFQQTYGLSELGILRSKSRENNSLWVRLGGEGFETKVEGGTLRIRAQSAMLGYLNAPNPFDEEGWFDTQDVVEVDGSWLKILGRKSEIINVGGLKVYPAEVESVIMGMENVKDVTVVGEENLIVGNIVVAYIYLDLPEDRELLKKRVREHCKHLESYKIPQKVYASKHNHYNERFKKVRNVE